MLILTSAVAKRLPDTTQVNLLEGSPSARTTGQGRKSSPSVPIRRQPQTVPVKGVSRPIEVKFASTESEWEQAFALAAASYQERGYESPGTSRLRFTPYHALPDTATLVAKLHGQVVATFSIVLDNTLRGLPMEKVYPEEINALRASGRRLLETTTLADADLGIREFIQVFITLIKVGMQYHTSLGGDTYVIAVNPRHRNFYTKMLGFVPLGPRRSYGAVQDAPAEAFRVDNDLIKATVPSMHENLFGEALSRDVLFAPKLSPTFIRQFSQQSSQCDTAEIEEILAFTDQQGSTRRW